MSEHRDEDLNGLDDAISERLRAGTGTRADEIAKLEHLRGAALERGDLSRVEQLDMQLSTLRYGE
ncbi:hypothetical protein V2S04_01325 [Microbacterium sp. OR21]|uniref:hypothetical protein n=1 Tax=Microbacterium sp. OR21 TaxID=3095346 RepID=UPI0039B51FDE